MISETRHQSTSFCSATTIHVWILNNIYTIFFIAVTLWHIWVPDISIKFMYIRRIWLYIWNRRNYWTCTNSVCCKDCQLSDFEKDALLPPKIQFNIVLMESDASLGRAYTQSVFPYNVNAGNHHHHSYGAFFYRLYKQKELVYVQFARMKTNHWKLICTCNLLQCATFNAHVWNGAEALIVIAHFLQMHEEKIHGVATGKGKIKQDLIPREERKKETKWKFHVSSFRSF